MIDSLTTDVTVVTEWPTVVTFFAQVSDPQGPDDIAAGKLHQGNLSSGLGFFEPTGEPGAYEVELTVDESQGWSPNAFVFLIATFRDQDGNEAERSKSIQLDIGGCSQEPDYDSCRACYCEADPEGCASYTSREYHHLYCGNECSAACGAFCTTVYAADPDPQLIDGFCDACIPSQADLAAFEQSCVADVPHCFDFLVDMGHCPRRSL